MNKICLICNENYNAYRVNQRYCSKSCGNKSHYINNVDKYKEAAKKSRPKQAEKRKEANKYKWFSVCQVCNKDFKKKCQNQKYCSIKCQREILNNKYDENGLNSTWRKNTYVRRKKNPIKYNKFIKSGTAYQIKRRKTDNIYCMIHRLRARTNSIFRAKGWEKNIKTYDLLKCSPKELKIYLEKQFKDNMNWNNRGEWHLDHIIPLSSANNEEELYNLCHYTNLQPLWAKDNLIKGAKL